LVEKVNEASRLAKIEDVRSTTPKPWNHPVTDTEFSFTGGQDGTNLARAKDFIGWNRGPGDRGGLLAFDEIDEIGLVLAPDLFTSIEVAHREGKQPATGRDLQAIEAVQQELVSFCERK